MTFHNLLTLQAMQSIAYLGNEDTRNLLRLLGGEKDRGSQCMGLLMKRFVFGVYYLYLVEFVAPTARDKIAGMGKLIQEELIKTLDSSWLDPDSKTIAVRKAKRIQQIHLYVDEARDPSVIDKLYNERTWTKEDPIYSALRQNTPEIYFKDFLNWTDWQKKSPGLAVNAYYEPDSNSLKICSPIAKFPVYLSDIPNYMTYGTLGSIIGHELSHAFDSWGIRYDETGKEKDWMKPESMKEFDRRAQCFVDQYNGYTIHGNITINGTKTLEENEADMGLDLAYKAFKKWETENHIEPLLPGLQKYSQSQLFWLGMASDFCWQANRETDERNVKIDGHSPMPIRVIGSMSNSEHFAKDFNCPAGSKMNPPKKCSLW